MGLPNFHSTRRATTTDARLRRLGVTILLVASVQAWGQPPAAPTQPEAAPVAGLEPHQRPAGAPALVEFRQTPQWRAHALQGVAEPVPPSLKFLDSQGAWYTPFNHPGMDGRYDLRALHRKLSP